MRERLPIFAGLCIFMALVTIPFWRASSASQRLGASQRHPGTPDLVLPTNAKQCVAPVEYMRTSHMQLLISWREDVVRRGDRQYHSFDGKVYEKSVTKTCLGCHTNKAEFCDRCHSYSGVSGPYCWDCHNQPQVNVARSVP